MAISKPQAAAPQSALERLVFDDRMPERAQIARRVRESSQITQSFEISISDEARALRLESELMRGTFDGVEGALFGVDDPLFDQAGRAEYLESVDAPDDLSAGATAERILDGITGYIYRAFQLGNPDADAEDFARFKSEVMRGFEQGLEEARGYIEALGDLTDEQGERIDEIADLVREGLDAFFDAEEERY